MRGIRRRATLFIARRFQIRYISLILFFMFCAVLLTGYTVYVTTWMMFGEKLAAVYPQGLLLEIVKKVNMVLILRLLFLVPLVILAGMVLSNRIAGPIYRIQRYLNKISSGNYENPLKLREGDELHDMAESLNQMVNKLRSEKVKRNKKVDDLIRETDELEAAVIANSENKEHLLVKIMEIREGLNKLGG